MLILEIHGDRGRRAAMLRFLGRYCSMSNTPYVKVRLFFVHLDQNSGPLKTQVFTETQGIFPKTQGLLTQIGTILVMIRTNFTKIV